MTTNQTSPISDPAVLEVVQQLTTSGAGHWDPDPMASMHRTHPYSLSTGRAGLLYLLARAAGASLAVEFATSVGLSTLYLAAAIRDNGGGTVIGSEVVPEKAEQARANLEKAGLSDYVDIRVGDARETLRNTGTIDALLLDGWPTGERPSLDLQVLQLLTPQMRPGAILLDDNGEPDVCDYLADPTNGFHATSLPIQGGRPVQIAVRS